MPPRNNINRNNSAGNRPGGGGGNNPNARPTTNINTSERNNVSKDSSKEKDAKNNPSAAAGTPLPSPPLSPTHSRTASGLPPPAVSAQGSAKTGDDKHAESHKPSAQDAGHSSAPGATGATGAPSTSTAVPFTGDREHAAEKMTDLVAGMRSTVGIMAKTFEVLHGTANQVAALGPAVDAHLQVQAVTDEVAEHKKAQEHRMQQEKERLQEQLKSHLREHLRPLANQIVADVVQREVVWRVSQKLTDRIPSSLRDEVNEYKLKILQAKARLHNSEARRHNALIRASGLEEPLQALLRPLDIPATSNAQMLTPPATASSTMSAASLRAQVGATGRDLTRLSVNTDLRSPRNTTSPRSAVGAATTTPDGMRSRSALVPPIPSPLFPTNLSTLVSLGPDEVKALVREYGLVSEGDGDDGPRASMAAGGGGRGGASPRPVSHITNVSDAGQSWIEAGLDGTREDDLNKFMRYIGVGFQVLPSAPVITLGNGATASFSTGIPTSPGLMRSPLVERPEYAFVR